jgi:formylglycine-generating enzyme required for sulfatase activity
MGQSWISQVDGMKLMCVPAGSFLMGAAVNDTQAGNNERPQHEVTLDAFWIDQTEVTNGQFEIFVNATHYVTDAEKIGTAEVFNGSSWLETKGANWRQPRGPGSDLSGKKNHPVVQVSWNDSQAYCAWVVRKLPSEAQWEKAARGPEIRMYPWGNSAPEARFANYNLNVGGTTEVGKYPQGTSPYSVLDLSGNVQEWVWDWYGNYSVSSQTNPTGPNSGTIRVVRGGSWANGPVAIRSSNRYAGDSKERSVDDQGFRCAR